MKKYEEEMEAWGKKYDVDDEDLPKNLRKNDKDDEE